MIFISAPAANYDGSGRLATLANASVWARSRFTPAVSGDYRLTCATGASAAFTTTGTNAVLGGAVAGASESAFIIAPSANFNAADELTSLTGCVLSASKSITGLLGGTSYRAIVLSAPSDVFPLEIPAEWVIVGTEVQVAPTPFATTTPAISGGVLSGPAGIYRVVNATTVTDSEVTLTPPVALSSLGTPGDSLTIYHLQFSSFSPDVELPAAAGISLVGSKNVGWTATASNQTFSLTDLTGGIGSAPEAGDYIVVSYAVGTNATPTLSIVTSGYGSLLTPLAANDTYDVILAAWSKFMGGSPDTSITVSGTGSSNNAGRVVISVYRGVNPTTPLDVAASVSPGTGTNGGRPTPPPITPVTSGAVVLAFGAAGSASGVVAPFTSDLSDFVSAATPAIYSVAIGAGSFAWASGTYTPTQWAGNNTSVQSSWAAFTIALRPA